MRITKNFNESEFRCRCCGAVKIDRVLVDRLQILRNVFGEAIIVNSGYRCLKHNTAVGGHKASNHMNGTACDIRPLNRSKLPELKRLADLVFFDGGLGDYPTFVHVDTGKYLRFKGK